MLPVKSTAAVLVASMSLFSAFPASAAGRARVPQRPGAASGSTSDGGTTPITGGSGSSGSGSSSGSGPVGTGSPTGSTGSGASNVPSGSSGGGSAPAPSGAPVSGGGTGGGATLGGSTSSPIGSGARTGGDVRPGPRSPVEQPHVPGSGPFSEPPRTMDGSEGQGFNFGNMVSGFYSFTSSLFQLVMTFAMLKQIFDWMKPKERPADTARKVEAVADRGSNVARDASTKVDEKLETEKARAEGKSSGGGADKADDAESSGMARE